MMKQIGKYLLILVGIIALWNTIIIKPLKLFTVFLHELGHSLMAFVFGYGIKGIRIGFNEGGYALTYSKGWISDFLIYNGGYLGSVLFSLLILTLKKTAVKKYVLGAIALIFLAVSIRYGGFSFILIYSIIFASIVLVIYMIQNEKVYDWAVDIIGIAGVAYAIYDTFVDTVLLQLRLVGTRSGVVTDAQNLARLTHIPAIVWGLIWLVLSLFAAYTVLIKSGSKGSSRGSKGKK